MAVSGQRVKLGRAQPGLNGKPIEHRPRGAGHAEPLDGWQLDQLIVVVLNASAGSPT